MRVSGVKIINCINFSFRPLQSNENLLRSNNWFGMSSCKYLYHCICALARVKKGSVADFGHKDQESLYWQVDLMRQLFDWECEVWDEFMIMLNNVYHEKSTSDKVIWAHFPSEVFSCNLLGKNCLLRFQ